MQNYHIGRQPIFDDKQCVIGYELLYRHRGSAFSSVTDGDQATSQIIVNSFWEMGLGKVVGAHKAFVNVTRNFLIHSDLLPPPGNQLVLEILEDILVDSEITAAVRDLKKRGYVIALDDFTYHPDLTPLMELADIVKLDVLGLDEPQLREQLAILRGYPFKLLAEKVETPEMFDLCRNLGFDYYQGYFLCRPRVLSGRRMPANRVNAMRMMAKLQRPELDIKGLEELVSQDPTMSYKLLRYINSAAFSPGKKIDSIHHAIVYLGEREIRRWANLIALTGIDDKPEELITTALIRARMCELLSDAVRTGNKDSAFIVGLFSTLDALMDQPIDAVLELLPLSPEISDALRNHTGPYAGLLDAAIAHERGEWDSVEATGIDQEQISSAYLDALEWAELTMSSVSIARSR
jgi:c-di-GMP phosphodiesterase